MVAPALAIPALVKSPWVWAVIGPLLAQLGMGQVNKVGDRKLRREEIAANERSTKGQNAAMKQIAALKSSESDKLMSQMMNLQGQQLQMDQLTKLMGMKENASNQQAMMAMQMMEGVMGGMNKMSIPSESDYMSNPFSIMGAIRRR